MTKARPTVVLADDSPIYLSAAAEVLKSAYEVVARVEDGEAARECVRRLRPDFLILDIVMPKLNGIELARQVRAFFPSTIIIFLTLNEDEGYVEEARRIAHGYVLKKRMSRELLSVMRTGKESLVSPALAER